MSNVAEIAARAADIGDNAGRIATSLDYEAREISSVMQRVQSEFGNQQAGQEAVLRLNSALAKIIAAGTAMRNEKMHGQDFIAKIRS